MCLTYHYTHSPCRHTEAICTEPCIDLGPPLGEHPNQSASHVFSSQDLGDPGSDCPECLYAFKTYPTWLARGAVVRPGGTSLRSAGVEGQAVGPWGNDRRSSLPVEGEWRARSGDSAGLSFSMGFGASGHHGYRGILSLDSPGGCGGRSIRGERRDDLEHESEQCGHRRTAADCGMMKKEPKTERNDRNKG